MGKYGKEADRLLERLGELKWKKPGADPGRVEASLRKVYEALGLKFPGFRWVPELSTPAQEMMRAGIARWRETGAVRHPQVPFHELNEAMHQATPTGAYSYAWDRFVTGTRMKCGNEPQDFRRKIGKLRDGANRAAMKLVRADAWSERSEAELKTAAEAVVAEADSLFRPEERKAAVLTLAHAGGVDLIFKIPRAAEYFAEWRFRQAELDRPLATALDLVDAVDAGLGYYWPGPAVVVAAPRPSLS